MSIPESLIARLRQHSPDFADEEPRDQRGLAQMIWLAVLPQHRHSRFPRLAAFTRNELRHWFGGEPRQHRLFAGKHAVIELGDNLAPGGGYCSGFMFCEDLLAGLFASVNDPATDALLDGENGSRLRKLRQAIDPHRAHGTTRSVWKGAAPANAVPVNLQALHWLRSVVDAGDKQLIDQIVKATRNPYAPGAMPIRYVQYKTGRIFAEGFSLQSCPKYVRNAAMAGCWDYDIENCHFAILRQLANRVGMRTPVINEYIACKKAFRDHIARDAHLDVPGVKRALLALMFGAASSASRYTSIGRELGEAEARRLVAHPMFKALAREVKSLRRPVISAAVLRGGHVVNALGIYAATEHGDGKETKLLAHILQGYEAAALRSIVREYGTRVLLCMHDGWMVRERLDPRRCEELIAQETGLHMAVEERYVDVSESIPPAEPRPYTDVIGEDWPLSLENQRVASFHGFERGTYSCALASVSRSLLRMPESSSVVRAVSRRPRWNFIAD